MRIANRQLSFKPGLWPTVAAALTIGITLHLANWQRERAAGKRILQHELEERISASPIIVDEAALDAESLKYRRTVVQGQWLPKGQIYLDNKTDGGVAGYQVITPLQPKGSKKSVLVNRGWIARGPMYPVPPAAPTPSGQVEVEGMIILPTRHFLELSATSMEGNVWQNLTIDRYRHNRELDVLPFVVLASKITPDSSPALKRLDERPDAGVDKHVEYMLTWLSLASTVLILWFALNLKFSAASPIPKTGNAP